MFSDKNLAYTLTILEAIEKIFLYTRDLNDPDTFYLTNDQLNFNATYTLLIVIGEESKKITTDIHRVAKEILREENSSVMYYKAVK